MGQNDTAKALVQDNITKYTNNIHNLLVKHEDMVMLDAEFNLLNRAVLSEIFYCDFLNVLMGWKLESANIERKNAPGIDLIDKTHKVAVQISLTCDHEKIQSSIYKFDKNWSRGSSVWHFYFVPLTEKVPGFRKNFKVPANIMFDKSADVLTKARIKELAMIPLHGEDRVDRLKSVSDILDKLMREQEDHDEVCSYLFGVLQNKRKYHPSFTLLGNDDIDRRLFPGIEESKVMPAVGEKNGAVAPIWDLIEEEQKEGFRHIVIEGNGGIGKSVSLLSVTEREELLERIPAIYVHMYDLVSDKKCITISEHINKYYADSDKIIQMAGKSGKPKLMVLLDGLNEVAYGLQSKLMNDIGEWVINNPGVQLIIASRPIPGKCLENILGREISLIQLRPLEWIHVEQYLKSRHIQVPEEKSKLGETIKLPLFLTLYAKTAKLRGKTALEGCPLHVREAVGPASLIWNYLQREVLRQQTKDDMLICVLSCELIAPYIGYRMEAKHMFEIGYELADELVSEAIHFIDQNRLPEHASAVFWWFRRQTHSQNLPADVNWPTRVLDECGIFAPPIKESEETAEGSERPATADYAFMHQNFRDCLAALHMVNIAETADGQLPEEWKNPIRPDVLEYAAELMDQRTAAKLWEMNRVYKRYTGEKSKDNASTYMQLELNRLLGTSGDRLDFSGMDLRGMSLTSYMRHGCDMELFRKPELSQGTHIDRKVFENVGHVGCVTCLAVLPDGRIVSGSDDKSIRIWDADTGECLCALEGHLDGVTCLALLPDGRIVSGSNDRTIRIWNADTGKSVRTLKGHIGQVRCLAVLPNGRVVSGSDDKTIRIWNADTGKSVRTLKGHIRQVKCLAVLQDRIIVSGSDDSTIRIWNANSGVCLRILKGHASAINRLVVLPDGCIVSGSSDRNLRIWRWDQDESIRKLEGHTRPVLRLAILSDKLVVSGSDDYTLRIWNVDTGESSLLRGHTDCIKCLAVLSDKYIVSGSRDQTLRIWNVDTGESLLLRGHTSSVECLDVLPNGRIVSGSRDKALRIWNADTGKCLRSIKGPTNSIKSLAILPDRCIASISDGNTCRIWDANTGVFLSTVIRLVVLSDGRIVSNSSNVSYHGWSENIGKPFTADEENAHSVICLSVLSDGRIVSKSVSSTFKIWNNDTEDSLYELESDFELPPIVLPKGRLINEQVDDYSFYIWNTYSDLIIQKFKGHTDHINFLGTLPDGHIISGSDDKTLRIWNANNGKCLRVLKGHTGSVNCFVVRIDGYIISGSDDGSIRIWDMDTGRCLDVLEATEINVSDMYFSNAVMDEDTARILYQNMAKDHGKLAKMYRDICDKRLVSPLWSFIFRVFGLGRHMGSKT